MRSDRQQSTGGTVFSRGRGLALATWSLSVILALAFSGCGGGGGGGGSAAVPSERLTVSGTVRDLSADGAGRVARSELPEVGDCTVRVAVDLDGDGVFDPDTETVTTRAQSDGAFFLELPAGALGSPAELRVEKTGFSTFVRRYDALDGSVLTDPVLSRGAVAELDLAGISASPARAGRKTIDDGRLVTVSLFRDRTTGRRSARAAFGTAPSPGDGSTEELARVSFRLAGAEVAEDTRRLYASVAYLDTVNDPDVMPGGFKAEGSGETPVEMLATYGASEIALYDELGNPLLTDPTDRSSEIQIRIAIPEEALEGLEDEDPATPEFEIPLFYYDDVAGIWRLHRSADGSPAYGVVEDGYGNQVDAEEIARMRDGETPWTELYGVGAVHHFSVWNCDRSGRSASFNFEVTGPDGEDSPVSVRIRKRSGGGDVTDYSNGDRRRGGKRRNLHAYRQQKADSIIRRLLDRKLTEEERASLLYGVMHSDNPDVMAALIEALRRYEERQRDEIAGETSDLKRGIMAIFRNKEITDAFIDTEGLDCSRVPDLCKGAIAAAAETVNRSTDAKKAVAFLMQIAVETYDPRNLNFEYAAGKGIEFLDIVVNTGGAASELKGIADQVGTAKELGSQALAAYKAYKRGAGSWSTYWDLASQFRDAMEGVKSAAATAGGLMRRAGRMARPVPLEMPEPRNEEEEQAAVEQVALEVLYSYDEVAGELFGMSRMLRYQWGYYDEDGGFHPVDDWPGRPAFTGSGATMMLEYYDGTDWVPLEGRSDLGVDASYIPVPSVLSYGPGSPGAPALNLGTFTLAVEPNLSVSGRVVTEGGVPVADVEVVVAGTAFRTDADGRLSGTAKWYSENTRVPYRIPDFWFSGFAWEEDGVLDLGDVVVSDRIVVQRGTVPWRTAVRRGETFAVDARDWARTLSGHEVSVSYALYEGWPNDESVPVDEGTEPTYALTPGPDTAFGYYVLRVTLSVDGDDSVDPQTVDLSVVVQNSPPEVTGFSVSPEEVPAGTPVAVVLTAADPDDDIQRTNVYASCEASDGGWYWFVPQPQDDGLWTVPTDAALRLLEGEVTCTLTGTVIDAGGQLDRATAVFSVRPNPLPPELASGGLDEEYFLAPGGRLWLASKVYFEDPNGDLARFELDCGAGAGAQTAENPWSLDPCQYEASGDYTVRYSAVDASGLSADLETVVHVLSPLRLAVAVDGQDVPDDGVVVDLPAGGDASVPVTVTVVSDNGPEGYAEGAGTIESGSYTVRYRSGNQWWWSETLVDEADLPDGQISLTVDRPGSYTVSVWAQDDRGMSARFSQVIDVTAPFDGELYVNGAARDRFLAAGGWVLAGEEAVFSVEDVTAPEGATLRYRWFVDGEDQGESVATTFAFTPETEGQHTVRVEIRNPAETTEAHKVVREVPVQVYAPVAVGLSVANEEDVRAGDLFEMTASVPDGVSAVRVRWSVVGEDDGGFRPVPTDDPLTAAWTFTQPGAYTVAVVVEDDRGVVTTETYGPFEVTSEAPEVEALSADPASGRPPVTATFTAVAADPDARDGEVLRYRWFVDGEPVAAGTDASFTHTFDAEGSHTVRVEVIDATGLTGTATLRYEVRDRPPVIDAVTVDPRSGVAPLSVQAAVEATDDGEVASVAWFLDGEPLGTGDTATHTFTEPGTYTVRVEVTDDAGQTTAEEVTVYAMDPSETGITFAFREIRADGFGDPVDFSAMAEFLSHEGGLWFARSPLDDLSEGGMLLSDLAPELSFTGPAFYGFHGDRWGDVLDTLVQVGTAGAYDVGVLADGGALSRQAVLPRAYECGVLVYGGHASVFGTWTDAAAVDRADLYPSSADVGQDGTVYLLALLGDRDPADNTTCEYTYAGFTASASSPIVLADGDEVALKSVAVTHPDGMTAELSDVALVVDGHEIGFGGVMNLPRDADGAYQVPAVAGAQYLFSFLLSTTDLSWTASVPVEGSAVAGDDPVVGVDLTGVSDSGTLALQNAPQGTFYVEVAGASGSLVRGSRGISEGTAGLAGVLTLADADRVRVLFDGDAQAANPGFYRFWSSESFPNPLDLSEPGTSVTVSDPAVSVDADARTVSVSYTATGADACIVAFSVDLDADGDGAMDRGRGASYLTDGSVTTVSVPYPLDALVVESEWGSTTYEAASDLLGVKAKVTCLVLSGGYDAFVRDLMERVGWISDAVYGWDEEDLADVPSVTEMVWRRASWTAP